MILMPFRQCIEVLVLAMPNLCFELPGLHFKAPSLLKARVCSRRGLGGGEMPEKCIMQCELPQTLPIRPPYVGLFFRSYVQRHVKHHVKIRDVEFRAMTRKGEVAPAVP